LRHYNTTGSRWVDVYIAIRICGRDSVAVDADIVDVKLVSRHSASDIKRSCRTRSSYAHTIVRRVDDKRSAVNLGIASDSQFVSGVKP
jgi:hypothetical protein